MFLLYFSYLIIVANILILSVGYVANIAFIGSFLGGLIRAIAVGAVILYHAQITIFGHQPFKGGFIGVDIFFVISGYLITSIILKELVTTGSFSFKHFYERRVRRILPALLFVMLVSLPFAWIYLLPTSYVDFSKSILYLSLIHI